MSYARIASLNTLWRALLMASLPTACAVGVTQEDPGGMSDPVSTSGSSSGGTLAMSGSTSVLPKAGTTGSAGSAVANPFGGTASTAGTSSGGQSAAGASGSSHGGTAGASGSSHGGTAGAGGSTAGGSSSGGTGGGSGLCACPTKKTWADNTSITFATGDCFDVAGAVYVYTGTKPQTWANKDCNPAMQLAWCSDVGADYKFTLCK